MNKMKQIAALTAMLVGVIMYASPAKSAVCFLPDDDGSCGGGDIEISDNNSNQDRCTDFKLSKNQRDSKEYSSDCYTCESCTSNNRTTYKCTLKSGATWYGGNLGTCCTNGETYDAAEGQCCPAGGCTHECDAPKKWSTTLRRCECPNGKETSTGTCCADEEHVDGTICCPEKKHNDGGKCVCDSQYNTDKDGNCVLPVGCTYEYRQATIQDSCGLRDFENTSKCMNSINGCQCYTQLIKVSSLIASAGTVNPINKISNKSLTCVDENNVTKYQTICEGTPKSVCDSYIGYNFVPNGCVSETYNNGFKVKGDEFGSCLCPAEYNLTKEEADQYDTNCYKCSSCAPIGSSQYTQYKYKCELKSGYQIVDGKCDEICKYKYTKVTTNDTCGLSGDLDTGKCMVNSCCFITLKKNESIVTLGTGTPSVLAYDRINNKSKTCIDGNGKTKYETICEGIPERKCDPSRTKNKFIPNGCVSDGYNYGVTIKGDKYGSCECNPEVGQYSTLEECNKHSSSCYKYTQSNSYYALNLTCYTNCEAQGYYSTEKDCLNGASSRQKCYKGGNCYYRKTVGFTITQSSSGDCGGWSFGLITPDGQYASGNGVYDGGSYSVVIYRSGGLIHYANIYSRQSGGGWCFGDQAEDAGCEKTESVGIGSSASKKHNFNDGMDYVISVSCK